MQLNGVFYMYDLCENLMDFDAVATANVNLVCFATIMLVQKPPSCTALGIVRMIIQFDFKCTPLVEYPVWNTHGSVQLTVAAIVVHILVLGYSCLVSGVQAIQLFQEIKVVCAWLFVSRGVDRVVLKHDTIVSSVAMKAKQLPTATHHAIP